MTGKKAARCPIEDFEYDAERQDLHILLRGGAIYTYHDVPAAEAEAFRQAPLRGAHYMRHIRDVYPSSGGSRGACGLTSLAVRPGCDDDRCAGDA